MQTTTNLALKKPDDSDFFNRSHQNDNMEILDAAVFAKADKTTLNARMAGSFSTTNVGNAYTTTTALTLTAGMSVNVTLNADSTGAVTLNTYPVLLNDGTGAAWTEAKANVPVPMIFNGTSFFVSSAGISNFFGDGSDGAFNPATLLAAAATAPNGGTIANLWDMNAGTVFTTGSLTSASECEILRIDFGIPMVLPASVQNTFYSAVLSAGTRNLYGYYSDDGTTWTYIGGVAVSTVAGNVGVAGHGTAHRYWKFTLYSGGSTCTFSCQGLSLAPIAGDTQTTKVWNIIYPSTLNGPAVVKQFSNLTLPAGYSMTVENPCQGLIIYCQGNAVINGTIDMSKKAGLAPNGNVIPMPVTKKNGSGVKTLEKYLQLTTVLQALRGGSGGNGGYGGGYDGSTGRQASVGAGGAGRVNQGGFGGGGSGGGNLGTPRSGAVGGSITVAEIGGGYIDLMASCGQANAGAPGSNGCGAQGSVYTTVTPYYAIGRANGGGSGGHGGSGGTATSGPSTVAASEYAGGFILLIVGGTISGSGSLLANGGSGSSGSSGVGTYAGGGGGGGGAGGGVIEELYGVADTFSGTRSVNGGTGGIGGAGTSTAEAGGAGSSGGLGTIHIQQVA